MQWRDDLSGYNALVADIRFDRSNDYITSDLVVNATYHEKLEKWCLKLSILFDLCLVDLQVLIDWAESTDTMDVEGVAIDMTKRDAAWLIVYGRSKESKYFKRVPYNVEILPADIRNAVDVIWAAVCSLPGKQDSYE